MAWQVSATVDAIAGFPDLNEGPVHGNMKYQ
jgi:hypothetical protein